MCWLNAIHIQMHVKMSTILKSLVGMDDKKKSHLSDNLCQKIQAKALVPVITVCKNKLKISEHQSVGCNLDTFLKIW